MLAPPGALRSALFRVYRAVLPNNHISAYQTRWVGLPMTMKSYASNFLYWVYKATFILMKTELGPCIGYLGHPFKNKPFKTDNVCHSCLPPKGGPSDKHRRVGVESDVVTSRLMLERRDFDVMEKFLVWLVFRPFSSASWMAACMHSPL